MEDKDNVLRDIEHSCTCLNTSESIRRRVLPGCDAIKDGAKVGSIKRVPKATTVHVDAIGCHVTVLVLVVAVRAGNGRG